MFDTSKNESTATFVPAYQEINISSASQTTLSQQLNSSMVSSLFSHVKAHYWFREFSSVLVAIKSIAGNVKTHTNNNICNYTHVTINKI